MGQICGYKINLVYLYFISYRILDEASASVGGVSPVSAVSGHQRVSHVLDYSSPSRSDGLGLNPRELTDAVSYRMHAVKF